MERIVVVIFLSGDKTFMLGLRLYDVHLLGTTKLAEVNDRRKIRKYRYPVRTDVPGDDVET